MKLWVHTDAVVFDVKGVVRIAADFDSGSLASRLELESIADQVLKELSQQWGVAGDGSQLPVYDKLSVPTFEVRLDVGRDVCDQ